MKIYYLQYCNKQIIVIINIYIKIKYNKLASDIQTNPQANADEAHKKTNSGVKNEDIVNLPAFLAARIRSSSIRC